MTPGRDSKQRTDRIVATVEQRARRERRERLLEPVVRRGGREHEMRSLEIAAEPRCSALDVAERGASGELLEEVLDQVLLREPLDQFDLLDRDGGLIGHRVG